MKDIRELVPDVETVVSYQAGGCYVMASDVQSQTDKLRKALKTMHAFSLEYFQDVNCDELIACIEELTGEKWEEIDG